MKLAQDPHPQHLLSFHERRTVRGNVRPDNGFDVDGQSTSDPADATIYECKQTTNGSIQLSQGAGGNIQGSGPWVQSVLNNIAASSPGGASNPAYVAVQETYENGALSIAVSAVNRTTGQLTIVPIHVPPPTPDTFMRNLSINESNQNLAGALVEIEKKTPDLLRKIREREGDPRGCMRTLMMGAQCSALLAWFRDHDLGAFKYWSFVAGRIDRVLWQAIPSEFRMSQLMYPLSADDTLLIQWIAAQDRLGWPKDADDPRQWAYRDHQAILALRGDFSRLGSRAERFLDQVPTATKKFVPDQRFYLALSRLNINEMNSALSDLTSPRVAQFRNADVVYPASKVYVSADAVIYAKIAWRHGLHVRVNTPYIPQDWLPIDGFPEREMPYDFLRDFDVDQDLEL